MHIQQGHSRACDGAQAALEATQGWSGDPDLILTFCSTAQDPQQVAQALSGRWPKARVVGCTTTGEHLSGQHYRGSLVAMGISSPKLRWSTARIQGLGQLTEEKIQVAVQSMFQELGVDPEDMDPQQYFCLCFVDGLSMKEEQFSAWAAEALEGIALLGGSAGDDLKFEETRVIYGDQASSDTAVLVLAHSQAPFQVIKHQHFKTTPSSLVVTRVDTAARRVYELDGYPALEAYARALGVSPEEVTGDVTFLNPVTFSCNNEIYVRSIQKIEEDGSIVFYCGVEEGMVLDIGGHKPMGDSLRSDMDALKEELGQADLLIACNCILRALEADQTQQHEDLGRLLSQASGAYIGFDTYGEQLNGLHINQTLVALALRDVA